MVNLDRVFFSMGWEERFPLSISWGFTRMGFDHAPIIVDNGESLPNRPRYSLANNGFKEKILSKWLLKLGI